MQEPGRRTTPPFAGVDLRRPKGYPASTPVKEEAPVLAEAAAAGDPCPRCESRDTKFCYYNNYNTSQPRHFCKSCRRYWTKGGCLRNVPVGGGSRKSSSSSETPKNPKRSKNSKRRRIAPAPESTPSTDANTATATATAAGADADAAPTGAAAKGNADDPATPPSVDEVFTDPSVALGLGLTDASGKELPDPSPFEWPSGCDLGSYRATGVFADTDPALFLNLP